MKTCYIFGAAPISNYTDIQLQLGPEDIVICADGGSRHAAACEIVPDWIVGDFDSSQMTIDSSNIIRVKPEKDNTDMELAINHGISLGYQNFVIYGALAGRFDHAMANIQMMASMIKRQIHITLEDEQNRCWMIQNERVVLQKNRFPYVSVFSFSEYCYGVTLVGMKYPLTNYTLTNVSAGLSVSNEILGQEASIEVQKGILLIICSKDKK